MSLRKWLREAERRRGRQKQTEDEIVERVVAFERAPKVTDRERLRRRGLEFAPAKDLDDRALARELARLVRGLAGIGVYLAHTDHLSDRELYDRLVSKAIDVVTRDLPGHAIVVDMLELWIGRNEDLWFRYYATDEERALGAELGVALPERERPPFDRDRRLPWPTFHQTGPVLTFRRVESSRPWWRRFAAAS